MIKAIIIFIAGVSLANAAVAQTNCYETILSNGRDFLGKKEFGKAIDEIWSGLSYCDALTEHEKETLKKLRQKAQNDWVSELEKIAKQEKASAEEAKSAQKIAQLAQAETQIAFDKLASANADRVRLILDLTYKHLKENDPIAAGNDIVSAQILNALRDSVRLARKKVVEACLQLAFFDLASGNLPSATGFLKKIEEMGSGDQGVFSNLLMASETTTTAANRRKFLRQAIETSFPEHWEILTKRYLVPTGYRIPLPSDMPSNIAAYSSFWLAENELTFDEFDFFCEATNRPRPDDHGWGRGKRPVVDVSWRDAIEYCNWRSQQENLAEAYKIDSTGLITYQSGATGYRLPTETEWQFAASNGPKNSRFSWGDDLPTDTRPVGNLNGEEGRQKFPQWQPFENYSDGFLYTAPVGTFPANEFGLHDMSGNVWEWCYDVFTENASDGESSFPNRVMKGGSWGSLRADCLVGRRAAGAEHFKNYSIGFRLARNCGGF